MVVWHIADEEKKFITMAISRWIVNLCCWPSTAAIAAAASVPKVVMFDLSSRSFISADSNFNMLSGLAFDSLTFDCRLKTSIACLGQKNNGIQVERDTS